MLQFIHYARHAHEKKCNAEFSLKINKTHIKMMGKKYKLPSFCCFFSKVKNKLENIGCLIALFCTQTCDR